MKKAVQIILFRTMGFLLFLIMLAIANVIIPFVNLDLYTSIVIFLNANLLLFFILAFVGLFNDLFWNFYFPFNLLAPVTGGALGVFITMLLYNIWNFIGGYLNISISIPIEIFYVLIFLLVMVVGYIVILSDHERARESREETKKEKRYEKIEKRRHRNGVEWEDVEKEFRLVFYNIGNAINKMFNGNRKKKRRRKQR